VAFTTLLILVVDILLPLIQAKKLAAIQLVEAIGIAAKGLSSFMLTLLLQ
jgi:hypothetical protein